MDNIILRCDPTVGGVQEFKLHTAYITLIDGATITGAINDKMVIGYHDIEAQLEGSGSIKYRFYILKAPVKIGPVFCEEAVFFTPFLVTHDDDTPFHCEDCARFFVEWFVNMQSYWAEEYQKDWWYAASQRQGTGTQRLS